MAFQFPTGWNSTEHRKAVTDPKRRFNSQRDGILPKHRPHKNAPRFFVSIPNGMEFYLRFCLRKAHILAVSIPNGMEFYKNFSGNSNPARQFQFPTGWNSTRPCEKRPPRWQAVSIPNGMEFYVLPRYRNLSCRGFNSQRDGILRR